MRLLVRLIVSAMVAVAVYLFSFWMVWVQILPLSLAFAAQLAALATGGAAGWWIWRRLQADTHGVFSLAARWAAVAGAIGFCGGFFGPMILTPGANQGPLLGLFITGPLGFMGGGIGGVLYGLCRRL